VSLVLTSINVEIQTYLKLNQYWIADRVKYAREWTRNRKGFNFIIDMLYTKH